MSTGPDSVKSILYALAANGSIAVAKLGAALYTGSASMLAESIHSAADCGNQALLLWGLRQARRPPDPDFPLGYGKAIYFWSFVVALILFSLGGLFSINEGWHKLHHPAPLSNAWVAVAVLVFALLAEGLSLYGCLREVNKVRHGRTLWRWFRESRHSELIVVLGEDIAAQIGLSLALVALLLAIYTGNPAWDAAGSIAIGIVLVTIAIGIAVEIQGLLIGQSADPVVEEALRDFFASQDEVKRVFRLLTLQLGASLMVSLKLELRDTATPVDVVTRINALEQRARQRFPQIQWLFVEPDIRD